MKCVYEDNNPYDRVAITTVAKNGTTVRHTVRNSKFFLDRGATMEAELTSRHYRLSPLVQGGMEILCLFLIKMAATSKNTQLAENCLELVKHKYVEPKEKEIFGLFVNKIANKLPEEPLREKRKSEKKVPTVKYIPNSILDVLKQWEIKQENETSYLH